MGIDELLAELDAVTPSLSSRLREEIEKETAARERDFAAQAEHESRAHTYYHLHRLAGGICHHFNNLLTVIMGFTELIESYTEDENIKGSADAIRRAGERQRDIIQQIAFYAQANAIKPFAETDVQGFIDEFMKFVNTYQMYRQAGITYAISLNCGSSSICADKNSLTFALENIVKNAVEATPQASGSVTISSQIEHLNQSNMHDARLSGLEDGDYLKIQIADKGRGMDEKTRAYLFAPFFTTKEVDQGLGMGLASAYGIIKRHKGGITCDSKLGKGTTFTIYIPCKIV